MSRSWETDDAIAERDGDTWHLGTVVGVDGLMLAIRFEGGERATFRTRYAPGLADPDDVPIDERHWLPQKVRDQLVRQEAAGRLRLASERLVGAGMATEAAYIDDVIERLADPIADAPLHLALVARALLAPAPPPATTP